MMKMRPNPVRFEIYSTMEPMTLGSPIGSPSSPGGGGGTGGAGGSSFLPAFLMGDSLTHSPHLQNPHSPQKTPRQVTFSTPRLQSSTPQLSSNDGGRSSIVEPRTRSMHVTQSEKAAGSPIVGLFDTLEPKLSVPQPGCYDPYPGYAPSPLSNITNTSTPCITNIGNQTSLQTPIALRDRDTSCEPGTGNSLDHWVTVFGFPPSSASMVLAQFSQFGQLQEHILPPKGNWMHLRYFSRMQARRALSYNGKVFGGGTMIGVVPCRDPSITKDLVPLTPSSPATPLPRRLASPPPPRTTNPESEDIIQQNMPTKSSSIVSRTFEYFLGW